MPPPSWFTGQKGTERPGNGGLMKLSQGGGGVEKPDVAVSFELQTA